MKARFATWVGRGILYLLPLAADANDSQRADDRAALPRQQLIEQLSKAGTQAGLWGALVAFDGERITALELSKSGTLVPTDPINTKAAGTASLAVELLRDFPATGLLRAAASYEVSSCPGRPIAGRWAACFSAAPKDTHRHGYEVWMDVSVPAVLAVSVLSADGFLLESARFVRPESGRLRSRGSTREKETGAPPALPRWLPEGFVLRSWVLSEEETVMRFSDGVAGFTLYATPFEGDRLDTGETVHGASVVVDRLTQQQGEPARLTTVAGEVPLATARRTLIGLNSWRP